jgi:hypothetical protein
MMKIAIGLFLIALAIVAGTYFTGVGSWDPTEIGREAKAQLKEGMSWEDVLVAAGEPKSRTDIVEKTVTVDGERVTVYEPSADVDFDETLFRNDFKAGNLKHGFILEYFFSQQVAFEVSFDGKGKVVSIDDVRTMADLFQTRE